MISEYFADLCFMQPIASAGGAFLDMEEQLNALFASPTCSTIERKQKDGFDMALVQVNGMSAWTNEDELIAYIQAKLQPDYLARLGGFRVQVIPVEDAGVCQLKK